MALVSSLRNLCIAAPFVDPDEATYAETIGGKEIEIRAANVVPGAGALVELRQHTATNTFWPFVETECVGEQVDSCDSATGWTAGTSTAVAADTGVKNEGTASIRATLTALAANGVSTNRSPVGKALKTLYGPQTKLTVDVRASSLTNVSEVRIRLTFTNGATLRYNVTPSTTNAWETKTLNLSGYGATSGTSPVNVSSNAIDRIEFEIAATAGGTVTGSFYLDNVRIGTPLTWESSYDVRVRYKDASGTFGPWSGWTTYKVSQPPTVAQAVAVDNTDAAPTLDWSFTSPGGKAQGSYRIVVTKNADGSILYDSGSVASSATVAVVPGFLIPTATAVTATVTAADTDGLTGTWSPTWTSSFSDPAALTSATATPSPSDSSVDVGWTISGLSAAQFYSYRVYRQDPVTASYTLIAEIFDQATVTYTDREAPHGVPATYQVRQTNGFSESDPVQATTTLNLNYWITHPTDPTLVFPIPYVQSFREKLPVQKNRFEALGRDRVIVVTGEALGEEGSISFRRSPSQEDPIPSLRRAQIATPYVVLKSPFGDVRRVSIDEIETDRAGGGWRTGSFDYTTVG